MKSKFFFLFLLLKLKLHDKMYEINSSVSEKFTIIIKLGVWMGVETTSSWESNKN